MFKIEQKYLPLVIAGIAFFLSYLIPLHIDPYRSFYNDGMAMLGVLLAAWYLIFFVDATLRIPNAVVVPFALIIIIIIQTAKGMLIFPADSIFPIIYLSCLIVAMILGASLAGQDGGFQQVCKALAITFIAAGAASFSCQLIQLTGLETHGFIVPLDFKNHVRAFANLGQSNLLALVMCFSIGSVWYLYSMGWLRAGLAIGLALLLLTGISLSQSRIAWFILPMTFVVCWPRQTNIVETRRSVLILLLAYFVLLTISMPTFLNYIGLSFDTLNNRAGQVSARKVMWEQAWLISKLHPWFGAGWFQFGPQQVIYSSIFDQTEYSEHAHNLILNFADEIGWPLTAILISGFAYWFYACCIRRWDSLQVKFLSLILLSVAFHSLVEYPLWFGYILIPIGVITGALHSERLGWTDYKRSRIFAAITVIPVVLLVAAIVWDYQGIANGFVSIMNQQASGKTKIIVMDKPEFTFYPQYYDYFHINNINIYPGMPGEDISFLERASLRFAFPPILQRLSMAYAYNKRPTEALRVLLVIQKLHENDYSETYARWGDFAQKEPDYFREIFKRLPQPLRPGSDVPDKLDQ